MKWWQVLTLRIESLQPNIQNLQYVVRESNANNKQMQICWQETQIKYLALLFSVPSYSNDYESDEHKSEKLC